MLKMPKKPTPPLVPVEVITTFVHQGVANRFMKKYIVIARSTSSAVEALKLEGNEEILQAKEMTDHKLVIIGR